MSNKVITLDQIDTFIYDINHNTDNVIRDFRKNFVIMETFFNDVITHYKDMDEEILLLIYLVLCMKTKLNDLDKSISKLVFSSISQSGGRLDESIYESLNTVLPLAFDCIYSEYAQYKMRYINELLEKQSITYLDQLLEPPILSDSTEIITNKDMNYFISYYHFYNKIMMYLTDYILIIEDEFRKNNLNELYRYYLYRRVLEINTYNKYHIEKNNILRNTIHTYTNGQQILNMLYGDKIEANLVNNVIDGLRSKVTRSSKIVLRIYNKLLTIKTRLTHQDKKDISYFSKTFDRLTNRVTNLLENKLGGAIIKQEEIGETLDIKEFRRMINTIIYSFLRSADTAHDFLIGQRTTPEFKKKDLLKTITFYVKNEKENQKKQMNYLEILQDMSQTDKFIYDEDINETQKINLANLGKSILSHTDFETNIMEQLNSFIYKIMKQQDTPDSIKTELLSVYRPGNKLLESILLKPDLRINTAQNIDKQKLIEVEHTAVEKDFFTSDIGNLMFVMYDDKILEPSLKTERKEIIKKVKEFLGIESVPVSVDFYSSSSTFFKIFLGDETDGGKNIFVRPDRVLAEIWDPASVKSVTNMTTISVTQKIQGDILDKKNYIPICDENYTVQFDDTHHQLYVDAGINIIDLKSNPAKIDVENIERNKQFHPEVKKIAALIEQTDKETDICKLLYLKNSGDWGQATSAKENKTFLLTEDKLCSYYSIITNTSTIYTIKRGNKFLTLLHRGNINLKWNEMLKIIEQSLIDNEYHLIILSGNQIKLHFSGKDNLGNNFRYEFIYDIDNKNIKMRSLIEPILELTELEELILDNIGYGAVTRKYNDKIKSKETNRDLTVTVINRLTNYKNEYLQKSKDVFLDVSRKKNEDGEYINTNYEEHIYSQFFDTYYYEIIDKTLTVEQQKAIVEKRDIYVKNKVIETIQNHIIELYLLSLKTKNKDNQIIRFDNYENALKIYLKTVYNKLYYTKGSLQWKKDILSISEDTYIKDLKSIIQSEEYKEKTIVPLIFYGSKKYKEYYKLDNMIFYHMENYHYRLPQITFEKIEFIPDILILSSISTTGIFDVFGMNPFIYSLFAEYLKINYNYKRIPVLTEQYQREKLKTLYSSILFDSIKDKLNPELIDFIEKQMVQYNVDKIIKKSVRNLNEANYAEFINNNIYKLLLCYYLYDKVVKNKNEKLNFKNKDTTIDTAKITIDKDKVTSEFVEDYLRMLEDITMIKQNTELLNQLTSESIISIYFDHLLTPNSSTNIEDVIEKYVEFLEKKIKSDVEYYSVIMSVFKTIIATLEQNDTYLDRTDAIQSNVHKFIFMASSYLEEYDQLIETIKPKNDRQFCALTQSVLFRIKNNIIHIPTLIYIKYLLEKAIEKRQITVPTNYRNIQITDVSRLDRIVEISKNVYPVEIIEEIEEKPLLQLNIDSDVDSDVDVDSDDEEDMFMTKGDMCKQLKKKKSIRIVSQNIDCFKPIDDVKIKNGCVPGRQIGTLTKEDILQILVCKKGMDYDKIKRIDKPGLCELYNKCGIEPNI